MIRRSFLKSLPLVATFPSGQVPGRTGRGHRERWVTRLTQVAEPVMENLSQGTLRKEMPVETRPDSTAERTQFAHLEAFSRLLTGIAPWLELPVSSGEEEKLRRDYQELARECLAMAVDPQSPDYMNFSRGSQPLVDTAFLAQALLRAPVQLWGALDARTQQQLVTALRDSRVIVPYRNNWILFSAMVEAALYKLAGEGDMVRISLALDQVDEWYLGDGVYGDGSEFRWDYYNSFVIQPFLIDILQATAQGLHSRHADRLDRVMTIATRYAEIQERMIAPDGSFPPTGRSLTYRFGAFHLLAQLALLQKLPPALSPAQVRSALSAVMERTFNAPDTFDSNGWLRPGLAGHQPSLAESYICTGSLYLCAAGFLPLGLPPDAPFWSDPSEPWTSQKVWSGTDIEADSSLK